MQPDIIITEEPPTSTILQAKLSNMAYKLNVPLNEVKQAVAAVGNDPDRIQGFLEQYGNKE